MEKTKLRNLPDTRLLPLLTGPELLNVWRDIIFNMKNLTVNKNGQMEQFFVYLLMTHAYLVKEGSTPNSKYSDTAIKGTFTYLSGFDAWVNTLLILDFIPKQHLCDDGKVELQKQLFEKMSARDGIVVDEDFDLEDLLNSRVKDKKLEKIMNLLLFENDVNVEELEELWQK